MVGARPGRWELLGEGSDPLPGDAAEVSTAATHYAKTATAIREQVARLRQIGEGHNQLVGKYQPALEKSAEDLADHLDQAQGRFDTVASQLGRWAPVLADAYTQTGSLLRQAEAAQDAVEANQPPDKPVDKSDDDAVKADKARDNRLTGAQDDLTRVKNAYDRLMNDKGGVKDVADDVAKRIDDASHDKLKDSWWDSHVRKWIHDHADMLKLIADVLSWIATAIIIVILVVGTGGLALAAVLLAGALLIHTMLALNDDGSWADVALDAFALATLGTGAALSSLAKTGLALDEGVTAFGRSSTLAREAFDLADGAGSKAVVWLTRSNPVIRNLRGLYSGVTTFSKVLNTEFEGAGSLADILRAGGRWSDLRDILTLGDKETAGLYRAVTAAIDARGPSFLLNASKGMLNGIRPVFVSAFTVDAAAKLINPAFPLEGVKELAHLTAPVSPVSAGLDHLIPDDPTLPGVGDTLKPPLSGVSGWLEEHTTRHGGYW